MLSKKKRAGGGGVLGQRYIYKRNGRGGVLGQRYIYTDKKGRFLSSLERGMGTRGGAGKGGVSSGMCVF